MTEISLSCPNTYRHTSGRKDGFIEILIPWLWIGIHFDFNNWPFLITMVVMDISSLPLWDKSKATMDYIVSMKEKKKASMARNHSYMFQVEVKIFSRHLPTRNTSKNWRRRSNFVQEEARLVQFYSRKGLHYCCQRTIFQLMFKCVWTKLIMLKQWLKFDSIWKW